MIRISIVIPNYNYGHFADRFFGSLEAQSVSLAKVEIIFVDDGSDDDSVERARSWAERIPCARFVVLEPPRTGRPGLVRNIGLERAEGEFLLCIDPDDTIEPDFLTRCLATFEERPELDVVYTDYRENGPDGARLVELPSFKRGQLRTQNVLPPCSMFRRRLWDAGVRYRENTDYEDWDFWVQCLAAGGTFFHLAEPLFNYEIHGTNFSIKAVRNDGKAKAQIVLNNPGFFHPDVERWATDLMRGRLYAQSMQRGYIPTPVDVAELLKEVERHTLNMPPQS